MIHILGGDKDRKEDVVLRQQKKQQPVIYVNQPDFQTPLASMQSEYHSLADETSKKEKKQVHSPQKKSDKKQRPRRLSQSQWQLVEDAINETTAIEVVNEISVNDGIQHVLDANEGSNSNEKKEDVEEVNVQEVEIIETDKGEATENKEPFARKPFQEMTVIEQVNYLTAPSKFIPTMKCEILTKDQRYRGKIIGKNDDTIEFETFKKPKFHEIKIDEIVVIRLLGF